MTHEQFITPEIARLANQAGFDWECRYYTSIDGDIIDTANMPMDEFDLTKLYKCPTQSVLQRWLREVKNCLVMVEPFVHNLDKDNIYYSYNWATYVNGERNSGSDYDNTRIYEAAFDNGLRRCLTLLIEKQ